MVLWLSEAWCNVPWCTINILFYQKESVQHHSRAHFIHFGQAGLIDIRGDSALGTVSAHIERSSLSNCRMMAYLVASSVSAASIIALWKSKRRLA
jgi:hypothetical protein